MRKTAVLGLVLIGVLMLATAGFAAQKGIPVPLAGEPTNHIDPYWDGTKPIVLSKAAGDTSWIRVHDDSSCSFVVGNAAFGGRGGGFGPGWATWCFDESVAGGLGDSCSTTSAYGGGLPGCWDHYDAHQLGGDNKWHKSTYDAYTLTGGDTSAWCGEVGNDLTWVFPPGYGPNYGFNMVLDLGTSGQGFNGATGFNVAGVHLFSVELAYDYCFVQMTAVNPGDSLAGNIWTEIARYNGVSNPDTVTCRGLGSSYWGTTQSGGIGNGVSPYLCAQYTDFSIDVTTGQMGSIGYAAGDTLYVRWLVDSDLAWDDMDGSGGAFADTRGAWRVDEISATANSGGTFPASGGEVDFENPAEDGQSKITFPLLPRADDGSGYWNVSFYVRGVPKVVDTWHLTNTPTYENQGVTCTSSNTWVWSGTLTKAGADGNIFYDGWHMRLVSPNLYVGGGNPYTPGGSRVTGNVIFYDTYLCIQNQSEDVTDTLVRTYETNLSDWTPFNGDGFVLIGGCEFWNVDNFDDWSNLVSANTDSIQYGADFFDQCDYNSATPLECHDIFAGGAGVHKKNRYIIDNISIGFYDQTATQWIADVQNVFQDTFERSVYFHPSAKENWELDPNDNREPEDSLQVTVTDIDGIQENSVVMHYRVSTNCGSSWDFESSRDQGSNAKPAMEWNTKTLNFSFPSFPTNAPPGRSKDGIYRTTLELNDTGISSTLADDPSDAPDRGLVLREGTVVEYYFTARDSSGAAVRDTFPNRFSQRRTFIHADYGTERRDPWPFEVTVLPCELTAKQQGGLRILLADEWYRRNSYDAEADLGYSQVGVEVFPRTAQLFEEALRDLGLNYDRYDNLAAQISRGSTGPFYSEPTSPHGQDGGIRDTGAGTNRYQVVIWPTGRHNQNTIADSSQTEFINYLGSGANLGNLWLAGQNVCEDANLAQGGFGGGIFWQDYLGAETVAAAACPENGGLDDEIFVIEGVNLAQYSVFNLFGGFAGCPLRNKPDAGLLPASAGAGTETVIFQFDNAAGTLDTPAGVRNQIAGTSNKAVTTLFDLGHLTSRTARACVTKAILEDFGVTIPAGAKYTQAECEALGTVDVPGGTRVARSFELEQNYPNPFNPSTAIRYALPKDNMKVELKIFDVTGREVRTLVNRIQSGANHEVFWDGRNESGKDVTSGVYFYRLTADDQSATKKMVLLK